LIFDAASTFSIVVIEPLGLSAGQSISLPIIVYNGNVTQAPTTNTVVTLTQVLPIISFVLTV
jgi:hypothetical protein